jgi:hypothetical protein
MPCDNWALAVDIAGWAVILSILAYVAWWR